MPDCKFCYPPEPWRIIWSTRDFNIQMSLGPLAEGHALIISKAHFSCCAELPAPLAAEFDYLTSMVKAAQVNLYGESLMFEHGRSGSCVPPGHGDDHCYHAHLHLAPLTVNLADSISSDFPAATLHGWAAVRERYMNSGQPYVLAASDGGIVYAETPDKIRSRYLRRIAAAELGEPEFEDWVAFPRYAVIRASLDKMTVELKRIMKEAGRNATAASAESSPLR